MWETSQSVTQYAQLQSIHFLTKRHNSVRSPQNSQIQYNRQVRGRWLRRVENPVRALRTLRLQIRTAWQLSVKFSVGVTKSVELGHRRTDNFILGVSFFLFYTEGSINYIKFDIWLTSHRYNFGSGSRYKKTFYFDPSSSSSSSRSSSSTQPYTVTHTTSTDAVDKNLLTPPGIDPTFPSA
jgi:hypothetical protein